MRYMGGKFKVRRPIADMILSRTTQRELYIEPFCGAASVLATIAPSFDKALASDAHEDLILLWRALQDQWLPPHSITREEYQELKTAAPSALRGFVGFGCSFGGKWFGGYGATRVYPKTDLDHGGTHDFPAEARRSLLKQLPHLGNVHFSHHDYRDVSPPHGAVIYCDPPYGGTTQFDRPFDSDEFWITMEKWLQVPGVRIFVSEYQAPATWLPIWEKPVNASLQITKGQRTLKATEKLFMHQTQA